MKYVWNDLKPWGRIYRVVEDKIEFFLSPNDKNG
jgi:hypothetical protein